MNIHCFILICLVIKLFFAQSIKGDKTIIVGEKSDLENCDNCSKFTQLLEGRQASFLSIENISLILLDEEYRLRQENFAKLLQYNNKTSYFFSNIWESQIRNLNILGGRGDNSFLSKIIFLDEIFSIEWRNLCLQTK